MTSVITGIAPDGTVTGYSNGYSFTFLQPTILTPPPTYIPPEAVATSTGVSQLETSYSLYGHIVPLSVFGVGRIGGEIIAGPWVDSGMASFIISFGVPADPSGTRDIREIAFDSEVVWTTNGASGVTTTAGGTFLVEAFTCRFYQGTLSQAADTLETTHFGANAVAYRPQILLAFSNLPIATTKFKKIPYVSAVIGDGSGADVNLGEAFERLAYSPWVGYTSAQFETSGITDGVTGGGLIIAQQSEFLALIQQFGRFYPSWDILQTDKLRIVDRGSAVTADINLNTDRLMGQIAVHRQGADTIKKDLELSTIDPDADYTIVPSTAQRPRDPVSVTTSIGTDTAYLPIIMDSATRISIVTLAKYHEEQTRKTISGTAMAYGLEIEPGSLVAVLDLNSGFHNEVFKVSETLHGVNNAVEFTAASILRCSTTAPTSGSCSGFTIPTTTGLVAWIDACVAANFTLSSGVVQTAVDRSSNAYVFGAGSVGPNYVATGFNSRPTLQFNGTATQQSLNYATAALGTGNTLTIFAACTLGTDSNGFHSNGPLMSYTANAAGGAYNNVGSFGLINLGAAANITFDRNAVTQTTSVSYDTKMTVIFTLKSDGTRVIYINGVAVSTVAGAVNNWVSPGYLSMGGSKFDSSFFGGNYAGLISEWGVYSTYSDATAVGLLHTYLSNKWGI